MKTVSLYIKKLASLFPHADKVLHLIAGFIISILILSLTGLPWFGFSGALLAGGIKEFHGSYTRKEQGWGQVFDWAATILGGLLGEIIFF